MPYVMNYLIEKSPFTENEQWNSPRVCIMLHKSRHKHLYPVWKIFIWHHVKHFTLGLLWAWWMSVTLYSNLTSRIHSHGYVSHRMYRSSSLKNTHIRTLAKKDMVKRRRLYSEDGNFRVHKGCCNGLKKDRDGQRNRSERMWGRHANISIHTHNAVFSITLRFPSALWNTALLL